MTQAVNAITTTMNLVASPPSVLFGHALQLTATVSANSPAPTNAGTVGASSGTRTLVAQAAPAAAVPTGAVTFLDGATTLGTATLNVSGVANLSVSTLSVGTHTLIATYAGDGSFASANAAATVTVNAVAPAVPAPTLSTWMLTLLSFGLLGAGLRYARLRR